MDQLLLVINGLSVPERASAIRTGRGDPSDTLGLRPASWSTKHCETWEHFGKLELPRCHWHPCPALPAAQHRPSSRPGGGEPPKCHLILRVRRAAVQVTEEAPSPSSCTGHPWVLLLSTNCQDKGAWDEEALQSPSSIFFSFSTLWLNSPAPVY